MKLLPIRAFVQARMSSKRFPGKVLAPFNGRPVVWHVLTRVARVLPKEQIVLATSLDPSDDPLAAYIVELGFSLFRGPLENVVERFQLCLHQYPCEWFFRISADSPLFDWGLMERMMALPDRKGLDLVTNIFPRTFPHGFSLEMINTAVFARLEAEPLSVREQEHATEHYYTHPERFRILNIESGDPSLTGRNFCVDTPEDIPRLERILRQGGRDLATALQPATGGVGAN